MRALPDECTISVCGHDYAFRRVDEIKSADGTEDYNGLFRPYEHAIYVREGMGERHDVFVTIHEIAHAIIQHSGLANILDDKEGEAFADAIAYGLLSVRVNGKALLR